MTEKEPQREKDVSQIVRYLTATFNQAIAPLERANRPKNGGPNRAYQLQTEFAYLLHEVVMGPRCVLQRNITECNEFIDQTVQEVSRLG